MSAVYDYEPQLQEDPMVSIVDKFGQASLPALTPEKAVLVRAFPFCKYLHCKPRASLAMLNLFLKSVECTRMGSRLISHQTRNESSLRVEGQNDRDPIPVGTQAHGEFCLIY